MSGRYASCYSNVFAVTKCSVDRFAGVRRGVAKVFLVYRWQEK